MADSKVEVYKKITLISQKQGHKNKPIDTEWITLLTN